MPVDASIYSEFKPTPIVNPLAVLMQLRGQTAEIQLHQAQAEHARQQAAQETLVTQQKQRQLRDESTLKEMMADPISGPKIAGGDVSPLNGRVDYAFQQQIAKNAEEVHKNAALSSKDDLENRSSAYSGLAQGLVGLGDDPATINERIQAFKTSPANAMLFKNAGIDPNSIPVVNDVNDLKKWEASIGIAQAVNDKALALKEKQAEIGKKETEAQVAATEAPVKAAVAQATLADEGLLTPEQREKATEAENKPASTLGAEEQFVQEYQRMHAGASVAQAQRAYALNKDLPSKADPTAALDRETTHYAKPHEKSLSDANAQLEKIADARAMVNGSAEAQALGIPKVLTALVSGQGSGVRITQAELNSIASARGVGGTLEGWVSQLSGQGKLNDTQKAQLTQILDDVSTRVRQKQAIANDALDRINSARSRDEIVKVDTETRHKLSEMEKGANAAAKPIVQHSASTGAYRYSTDGGKTWHPGQPPAQ